VFQALNPNPSCLPGQIAFTRHYRIWYSYNNDPLAQLRHRSSQHEGVASLEMHFDESRHQLVGRYYTASNTSGDIDVQRA
jgi:hypothetical protein